MHQSLKCAWNYLTSIMRCISVCLAIMDLKSIGVAFECAPQGHSALELLEMDTDGKLHQVVLGGPQEYRTISEQEQVSAAPDFSVQQDQ